MTFHHSDVDGVARRFARACLAKSPANPLPTQSKLVSRYPTPGSAAICLNGSRAAYRSSPQMEPAACRKRLWDAMTSYSGWSRRRLFLWSASLFSTHFAARGQDAVFTTEVKVVNIFATVRDKSGKFIRDLGKEDFSLTENGRSQSIRYFSRESDLPLILGLMIDTSMSQQRVLDAERGACLRFLDQVLRETKDKVFIMQFDMGVYLRQELTSSSKSLDDTLPFVDTPSRRELQAQSGGGTRLYDAVEKASREIMSHQSGRKALIVLSDGVDDASEASLALAIEAAQRADAIVYSILFSDAGFYGVPLLAGVY